MFSVIATMFSLCFSTIAELYLLEADSPDFLSGDAITIEIEQNLATEHATVQDFITNSTLFVWSQVAD